MPSYQSLKNITAFSALLTGFLICLSVYLMNSAENKELIKIAAPLAFIGALSGCLMARASITCPGEFHFNADGEMVPPDGLTRAFFSGVWHGIYGVFVIGWFICGMPTYIIVTKILRF